jgi:hypothetical protein
MAHVNRGTIATINLSQVFLDINTCLTSDGIMFTGVFLIYQSNYLLADPVSKREYGRKDTLFIGFVKDQIFIFKNKAITVSF